MGDGVECKDAHCPPPRGACCVASGDCYLTYLDSCMDQEHQYFGDGSTCEPVSPCGSITGACCVNGDCHDAWTPTSCLDALGDYQGDGISCSNISCQQMTGACCVLGHCETGLTQDDCANELGTWEAPWTTACRNCMPLGACCYGDNECQPNITERACTIELHGVWQGPDSDHCEAANCTPVYGVCCARVGEVYDCLPNVTEAGCYELHGGWEGPTVGPDCQQPCPPTGACCKADSGCEELTQADCLSIPNAAYRGDRTLCATTQCPLLGACCVRCSDSGHVCYTYVTQSLCNNVGGEWWGDSYTDCHAGCFDLPTAPSHCSPESDDPQGPAVAPGGDCNPGREFDLFDRSKTFTSACWYSGRPFFGYRQWPHTGFPLNLEMQQGFGPGDYPPLEVEPALSSVPFVSGETRYIRGPVAERKRATLNGMIDFVTGMPLVQEADFELPFGSAVFRHVRTYSENMATLPQRILNDGLRLWDGSFWDWNGKFWMMSENPILLIDAQYADTAGRSVGEEGKKTCYFIPDAHHAVPFTWNQTSSYYEAPAWFDAALEPSSTTVDVGGEPMPAQFHVWLNHRSVKYTFTAIYEDLWSREVRDAQGNLISVNVHKSAAKGGHGLPYYGVLSQISDRYGNRAEYEYCKVRQGNYDGATAYSEGTAGSPCCKECYQNCNEKGQLKTIKLITADDQTAWTLVYTHRAFGIQHRDTGQPDYSYTVYLPHALHTIHVYRGAISDSLPGCLTLDSNSFCDARSFEEAEGQNHQAIDEIEATGKHWVIEARYLYTEKGEFCYCNNDPTNHNNETRPLEGSCDGGPLFRKVSATFSSGVEYRWPHNDVYEIQNGNLVKVTVTTRQPVASQGTDYTTNKTYTMYRYRFSSSMDDYAQHVNAFEYLKAIYSNATVQAMMEGLRRVAPGTSNGSPNFILGRMDDEELAVPLAGDPNADWEYKTLDALADVSMGLGLNVWSCDQARTFLSSPPVGINDVLATRFYSGRNYFRDRRPADKGAGTYHINTFIRYPDGALKCGTNCGPCKAAPEVLYHFPYRFRDGGNGGDFISPSFLPSDYAVYIVIMDNSDAGDRYDPNDLNQIKSRRIVELNKEGWVLRDRTWAVEHGSLKQTDQSGSGQLSIYDSSGHLTEVRSRGWDSQTSDEDRASKGLIQFYEYYGTENGELNGYLKAEGFKWGADLTKAKHYTHTYARGYSDRPQLVTKDAVYATAVQNADPNDPGSGASVTITAYEFGEGGAADGPIVKTTVTRPAVAEGSGDQTLYHSVQKTVCDDKGNAVWVATGSVDGANNAKEMFLNYTAYNELGQPTMQIVDANTQAPPPGETTWATQPPYPRTTETPVPPLNYTTTYEYDPVYGLVKTVFPNGRQQRVAYVQGNDGSITQWVFADLVPVPNAGTPSYYKVLSPVQIRTLAGGKLIKELQVRLEETNLMPDGVWTGASYTIISSTTPSYDANGRLVGVSRADSGNTPQLSASVGYDSNGGVSSQNSPDGTITRYVHDELGRLLSTYRGTNDYNEFWTGLACPELTEENQSCGPCTAQSGSTPGSVVCVSPDNMVLIEKRYYGLGVNDAGLVKKIRSYRDKPQYQYAWWDPKIDNGDGSFGGWADGNAPDEDNLGWTTNIQYDWRMRPVWEQHCRVSTAQGQDGAPLTHKLTWYDNLDRVRFEAEYGATAPAGGDADPRAAQPGEGVPAASAILGASPAPLSLAETIYNDRGQAAEVRRYNVATTNGSSYTATQTYFNYADKPVEVRAPNAAIQRYTYDGKGRQIRSATWAGGAEVARTETAYDLNDRAVQTTYLERKPGASGDLGDDNGANCVKSYTHTWYDKSGRVIATVNYGTNHPDGVFDSVQEGPAYDPDTPPVQYDSGTGAVTHCGWELFTESRVLLTCYEYDQAGRQAAVFHPDGTVTRSVYDDLGRLLESQENADAEQPALRQRTAYEYDTSGRLSKIKAIPSEEGEQVTELLYGADVVDSGGGAISVNNSFIKEVRFPDRGSGQPSGSEGTDGTDKITFTYYSDGSVATRTDQRGMVFSHAYDELGRRTETWIYDSAWYNTPPPGVDTLPPNRIHRLTYSYNSDGTMALVTAYDAIGQNGVFIAQNQFEYDVRGNLTVERQAHGQSVASGATPTVGYAWDYQPAVADQGVPGLNYERLAGITYPQRTNGGSTQLAFGYDGGAGIDSVMSRISGISLANVGQLAGYDYAGSSRRVGLRYGATGGTPGPQAVRQSFLDGSGVCTGLDRFGRVKDLHFQSAAGGTLHRYQYGYDKAGNRTFARVTQYPTDDDGDPNTTATLHENDRSNLYAYDKLQRLVSVQTGRLNESNDALAETNPIPRITQWGLDNLGNWSGSGDNPGVIRGGDLDGDGLSDVRRFLHHGVNQANEITAVGEYLEGQSPPSATPMAYDPSGNLAGDGVFYYQYDAWNRLVQVNAIGTALVAGNNSVSGVPRGKILSGVLGDLVCRYTYDGLGRLILKETPINTGFTSLQRKDLYYDGVRRIQEVITRLRDPADLPTVPTTTGPDEMGNDELPEELLLEGGGQQPMTIIEPPPSGGPLGDIVVWTDREYVYGPAYVDEFVCQLDRDGRIIYMLQDGNYNVVALISGGCGSGVSPENCGTGVPPVGTVLEQYTYDPYGTVLAAENLDRDPVTGRSRHVVNRVGFQGLFFERYDGSYTEPSIAPGVAGLYYMRARFYDPVTGRLTSRDPNETGIPIIAALAMNGEAMSLLFSGFDAQALYGDGMHLYLFAGANPVNGRDPAGLDYNYASVSSATYIQSDLRARDAQATGAAALLMLAMLGCAATNMQWGVLGGMTSGGFDLFLEGVSAVQAGAYSLGEGFMTVGEATVLTVIAMTQADAVKKARECWAPIALHFVKISTGGQGDWGSGPEKWLEHIQRELNKIMKQTKWMGRKTCEQWVDWVRRCLEAAQEAIRTGSGTPPPMPG